MLALDPGTANLLLTTELGAELAGTVSWLTASSCLVAATVSSGALGPPAHSATHMLNDTW